MGYDPEDQYKSYYEHYDQYRITVHFDPIEITVRAKSQGVAESWVETNAIALMEKGEIERTSTYVDEKETEMTWEEDCFFDLESEDEFI